MLRLRGFAALFRHEYAAATGLLEQALAGFEALDDRRGVAWARQNLAWCAFYLGRAEESEVLLRKAAATFEEIGDQAGLRWARGLLAWARFQQGHTAEAGEMADAILAGDRRGGDRWALGMMLVLSGSVRLWTGRTTSAIDRLREAQELFEGINDDFGHSQASAVLGRALVLAGHIEEGIALVTSADQHEGWAPTERERTVAAMAGMSATVQVGDTERSEQLLASLPTTSIDMDEVIVGDTERTTSLALHRLQSGDVDGAVAGLTNLQQRLLPKVDPNLQSALALAHAASGAIDQALNEADEVDAHDGASYLDRITAGIARGLALARGGDGTASTAAFDQVIAAADATEDRVSQALVRLAERDRGVGPGGGRRRGAHGRSGEPSRRPRTHGVGLAPGLRPRHGRPRVAAGRPSSGLRASPILQVRRRCSAWRLRSLGPRCAAARRSSSPVTPGWPKASAPRRGAINWAA